MSRHIRNKKRVMEFRTRVYRVRKNIHTTMERIDQLDSRTDVLLKEQLEKQVLLVAGSNHLLKALKEAGVL